MKDSIEIAVIGGSGFYNLFENAELINATTPYGHPSEVITIGTIHGKKVAFLPRHGKQHSLPPHLVPYKANIQALHDLGVKKIIAPTACGSLRPDMKPGDFVFVDQFINFTNGRDDTYFLGPQVEHLSAAYPYNEPLRQLGIQTAQAQGLPIHTQGTVVVIQGPRFSTKAESQMFMRLGADIINMTQYPECVLALEKKIDYVNISVVTDYDSGLEGRDDIAPVTMDEALKIFNANIDKLKVLISEMIKQMD